MRKHLTALTLAAGLFAAPLMMHASPADDKMEKDKMADGKMDHGKMKKNKKKKGDKMDKMDKMEKKP